MEFKKILVTGGCGAIGSEVINRLKAKHTSITLLNLDCLTYAGNQHNIEPPYDNYRFVYGSICDERLISFLLKTEAPDAIIHFAAETHVDNSFGNSFQFTRTNVYGTHVLLECVRQYIEDGGHFKLFLHISTDEVYGAIDDNQPACSENSLFFPSNPYSATKAAAEMICHAYTKSFKIPLIITRCNNVISKYQHREKLIPMVIHNMLNNLPVTIHGNGTSKRTFIHVYDVADALETIMIKGEINKVYNIGTDSYMEKSVLEVVKEIGDCLGISNPTIDHVPDRAFQDYRYSVDSTELRKLGWQPNITFLEAINDVISHLQTHNEKNDQHSNKNHQTQR